MNPEMLHETGSNVTTCCGQTASGWADIVVRSAGFSDGNEASFRIDGKLIYDSSRRGLTVVVLRPDLVVKSVTTYDTFEGSGADRLESFLNGQPQDTLILVGAADEASNGLSVGVKEAIKGYGAMQIDAVGWRSSYALVGRKGGAALAEAVKDENAGFVIAVAQAELITPLLSVEPCNARVAEPPVSGFLSEGNLYLDAGCHYKLWETKSAGQCLNGAWIVLGGTSNMLLYFNTLVKLLAPDEAIVKRGGEKGQWGNEDVIDVFIQNGQIIHWNSFGGWDSTPICRQINKDDFADNDMACRALLASHLNSSNLSVPVDPSNTTRVTMFMSFFWDRVSMAVDLVEADDRWASSDVAFVVQVVAWYRICNVAKWSYCPRKELFDLSFDAALELFGHEMESAIASLERVCMPNGRAWKLGCAVGTNTWSHQGVNPTSSYSLMNDRIRTAMKNRSTATLRHVDFYALGAAMTHEVENGHGSQVLNLWSWQVVLNGMCSSDLAPQGSWAVFDGPMCSATEASFHLCPDYVQICGDWCELWYCMNSVPCSMTPVFFDTSLTTSTSTTQSPELTASTSTSSNVHSMQTSTTSTAAKQQSTLHELAVVYSFGTDGSNLCPEPSIGVSKKECQDVVLAFDGVVEGPMEVNAADEPRGCFDHGGSMFYNTHASGSGRPGRMPYCKSLQASCSVTTSSAPWMYIISTIASNTCPEGGEPLTVEECSEVERKSDGTLRNFKQINTVADPKGCFKFGVWSLYYNAHDQGAVRDGRYPICRLKQLV